MSGPLPPELVAAYGFLAAFAFLLGACVGSFLNVCIYRIPNEQSIVLPRSHCPSCKTPIPWYLNVPFLSYLLLRGQCRYCHARISPRYLLVEVLTAVLFLMAWLKLDTLGHTWFGMTPVHDWRLVPVYWLIIGGLILGTFVDFEHLIIPDRVTWGGMAAGLILSPLLPALHGTVSWSQAWIRSGIGAATGFGILWLIGWIGRLIYRKEAMGFGDVKLLGAIGAFLGWRAVLFTLGISSLVGSIVGITLVLARNRAMQSRIPYGPYLALAAVLWIFWGPTWWQAYLDFLVPFPGITPP